MEANASRYHGKAPEEIVWAQPERQTRAVREYLAALEADAEPNPDRKPPKVISPSDPCAAWTAKANKRVQFGYGLNYLVDIENAVIVDVEPTPARTYDEVQSTKIILDRTERCFGIKPKRLAADTASARIRAAPPLPSDKVTSRCPHAGESRDKQQLRPRLDRGLCTNPRASAIEETILRVAQDYHAFHEKSLDFLGVPEDGIQFWTASLPRRASRNP